MTNTDFIADSRASKEAMRLANLLKNLNLNALITGENGVGKTMLAKNIVNANVADGEDLSALINALSANSVLIIKNFHKISNFILLKESLKSNPTRIIATSNKLIDEKITDAFFGVKIAIPSLAERLEDVAPLAQKFYEEARMIFGCKKDESKKIDFNSTAFDLSDNAYSLKRSVYTAFLVERFKEEDILNLLEKFLEQKIGGGDDYRKLLYIFEAPLLKAGFKKFHSQLSIAKNFGLNRNTLRKKIFELNRFLKNRSI